MEPHAEISPRFRRRGIRCIRSVLIDPRGGRSKGSTYTEEWSLMYRAISSSVFAEASGSHGVLTNPFQALAVTSRLACLTAATIVLMSKSVDKRSGSTMGGSNGFRLLSLTVPPVQQIMRDRTRG